MLVRSLFASYSKLLAGVSLAFLAIALTGCNDKVAEKAVPSRPVWRVSPMSPCPRSGGSSTEERWGRFSSRSLRCW